MRYLLFAFLLILPLQADAAVARVAGSVGSVVTATSETFSSPNCTGTNLYGVVSVVENTTDLPPTATWNGTSMTLITKMKVPGDRWNYYLGLKGISTGVVNIVVTPSSSTDIAPVSVCYSGVNQVSNPDTFNSSTITNTSATHSATTTSARVANAMSITTIQGSGSGPATACTLGTYESDSNIVNWQMMADKLTVAAGQDTITCTWGGAQVGNADIIISLAPGGAVVSTPPVWPVEF
jgi:hypothetical protein